MSEFPHTQVGDLSLSRLVIGTNWFMGFSHQSRAKDRYIKEVMTREAITDVLKVFMHEGVDTMVGGTPTDPHLIAAVKDAEDATGRKLHWMGTPHLNLSGTPEAADANNRTLDSFAEIGCAFCMPHQATTDAMANRVTRRIEGMAAVCAMIRERGMRPGLSTHMPETIPYADEEGLDVDTYIQIYNAAGFLMQVEVDWVQRIIWNAKKPVLTIKPLAAGRLHPLVGLTFAWNTIREQDMVAVGTLNPDEAAEVIEMSYAALERRLAKLDLQRTRSKHSIDNQ